MLKNDVDAIFFQFKTVNVVSKKIAKSIKCLDKKEKISNINENPDFFIYGRVAPWSKIYNRKFILDNNIKFDNIISAEDRIFYMSLIVSSKKIMVIKKDFLYHRVGNDDSLVGKIRAKNFECHFAAFDSMLENFKNLKQNYKEKIISAYLNDIFNFYHKFYNHKENFRDDIFKKMHNYFKTLDFFEYEEYLSKAKWWNEFKAIKNGDQEEADKQYRKIKRKSNTKKLHNKIIDRVKKNKIYNILRKYIPKPIKLIIKRFFKKR